MNSIVRLGASAAAFAGVALLAGCNTSDKVTVAEVNQETITSEEYYPRVMSVTTIPDGFNTDAGGLTMINMIREKLVDQLARKRNALPTADTVSAAVEYQIRMDPNAFNAIMAGKLSRDDLQRQKKFELEAFNIGTESAKATDQDIDKAFEENKDKPDFRVKANYTVKILQVPDDATGRTIVAELKKTADFKAVAQKSLKMSEIDATNSSTERRYLAEQLPPELRQALDKLKPNEITPMPVGIKNSNPQQPLAAQFVYAVAQLKSRETEHMLNKSDLKFLLSPLVLQKTHTDWKEHYRKELADFTNKSKIRVSLAKYEPLVGTVIRPLATMEASGHPPVGMQAPPSGAQPSGAPPSGAQPSGAPPSGAQQ